MQTYVTDSNGQPKRLVAEQIAKLLKTEIVDSVKAGKAREFFTADFRVIRVY